MTECPSCYRVAPGGRSHCPHCGWELSKPRPETFLEAVFLPLLLCGFLVWWIWLR